MADFKLIFIFFFSEQVKKKNLGKKAGTISKNCFLISILSIGIEAGDTGRNVLPLSGESEVLSSQ